MQGAPIVALVVITTVVGCAPAGVNFEATPRHICAGQRVTLSWDVVGSATIAASPPVPGIRDGAIPPRGKLSIAPMETTDVTIHATKLLSHPTSSVQTIVVRQDDAKPETLSASLGDEASSPSCASGVVSATIHAKRFSAAVKAGNVAVHTGDHRSYRVSHEGVQANISPGRSTDAFQGTSIAGDWLLSSPLAPGEQCGTSTLPRSLMMDVTAQCSGGDDQ